MNGCVLCHEFGNHSAAVKMHIDAKMQFKPLFGRTNYSTMLLFCNICAKARARSLFKKIPSKLNFMFSFFLLLHVIMRVTRHRRCRCHYCCVVRGWQWDWIPCSGDNGIEYRDGIEWEATTAHGEVYSATDEEDLPLNGMNTNACQFTSCPIRASHKQSYTYTLPLAKKFPVVCWKQFLFSHSLSLSK